MRAVVRLALAAAAMLAVPAVAVAAAAAEWLPMPAASLEVVPGSPLDLSGLTRPGPAGAQGPVRVAAGGGFLEFAGEPGRPVRFNCSQATFVPPAGGLPDKPTLARLVRQLKLGGYDAVRIHFIDAVLMGGRRADFDYDPVLLDRYFYFLAEAKAAGLYWIVDLQSSWNGARGNIFPHRWVGAHSHAEAFVSAEARAHWRGLVETLHDRVNPYTGATTLADPALAGVNLANENGLDFQRLVMKPERFEATLGPAFARWLAGQYGSEAALRAAWGALPEGESLAAGRISLPGRRETSARSRDFHRFTAELELDLFREQEAHLRGLGYRGPVATYNTNTGLHSDLGRSRMASLDLHEYHTVHSSLEPGGRMEDTSSLDTAAGYIRRLAWGQHAGAPLIVSEIGHPYWNSHRHEFGAVAGAYAALHGWSALCRFSEPLAVGLETPGRSERTRQLMPGQVAIDPVLRASETVIAFLYRRGDVATDGGAPVTVGFRRETAFGAAAQRGVPEPLSLVALLGPVRIRLVEDGASASGDAPEANAAGEPDVILGEAEAGGRTLLEALQTRGALPADVPADLGSGRLVSRTREIRLDRRSRILTVVTPRSIGVAGRAGGRVEAGGAMLDLVEGDGSAFLIGLDGEDLASARRLLLIYATDAINTGARFAGPGRSELVAVGTAPILVRAGVVRVALAGRTGDGGCWRAFALGPDGRRTAPVALTDRQGRTEADIDTARLPTGPSTYFEITRVAGADCAATP
ncbi:hypothetical protein [Prosthecomicrobium sp. N25]|uniref:hypothetical protein n=1 Tax=Prosthecomicrobium sp. N25 TaxID=3129254 RepID=UPI003077535F